MSLAAGRRKRPGDPGLAARLRQAIRGEVLFDAFTRGRYSTDASIYQIEPIGVTLPEGTDDVEAVVWDEELKRKKARRRSARPARSGSRSTRARPS